jgi:N-acetyl-gamma-glutamyl-phosphate reductase
MKDKKISVGIVGGAGYTGGETIRLLLNHPHVELSFVHSRSNAGKPVHAVHQDLLGDTSLLFADSLPSADVVFFCLGHGESKKFMQENSFPSATRIIDLSHDFRLGEKSNGRSFVYGLPEANKSSIQKAGNIANPGCFATAIQLGLLPLAKAGILKDVFVTGITGSTGAGQKLQDTTHFTWRANNISAYKTLKHQHMAEVHQTLQQFQKGFANAIHFIPWRGDFTRGIFVSQCLDTSASLQELTDLFTSFYKEHPFTHVVPETIDLKQVVNTNKCLINLEKEGDKLVVHVVIDNLLKGASGQAVQNMNLMFGLPETSGLLLKPIAF